MASRKRNYKEFSKFSTENEPVPNTLRKNFGWSTATLMSFSIRYTELFAGPSNAKDKPVYDYNLCFSVKGSSF